MADCNRNATRVRGFRCPSCGEPLFTVKTVRAATNIVTRYRRCETPRCPGGKRRIVTEERPRPPALAKRRRD